MRSQEEMEEFELFRVRESVTIRDLGGGREALAGAMANLSAGDELHLADVIGKIEGIEEVRSGYPGQRGWPRTNILLRGLFETTFAYGGENVVSRRVWLPDVTETVRFSELASLGADGEVVLAQLSGDRPTLRQHVVAVGPEGGWSTDELASELISWCRERQAGFKCPRTVDFTVELPRQDNGKLYKRSLRDGYLEEAGS